MVDLQRLLGTAGIDPAAAPRLLEIAATHLRNGEALPPALASYLAIAFEKTAKRPQDEQAKTLTDSLGIGVVVGRPKKPLPHGELVLAVAVYGDTEANEAETGLRSAIAEAGSVSKNTAKTRIEEARDKLEEARKYVGNIRMSPRGTDSE
jgi:hypothetical protein